ncbi:MAG: hypothetical protein CVU41_01830 [Chloroflexi bacterium HGW-Chloroflexi-3]|nr:MAG: hypothetical protein CVU41_01830 [Chloroflexi bacterium HGW-Chloroflexi-3]
MLFELIKKDGKLFARGVSDDKGQIISRLAAIDSLLQENDLLSCNIKFVIEGEEEVSSRKLQRLSCLPVQFVDLPQVIKEMDQKPFYLQKRVLKLIFTWYLTRPLKEF